MQNGPNKLKYTKIRKKRLVKFESKSNKLKFGKFGLKALESGLLNFKQIDSAKQIIRKKTKRKLKLWVKIFPYLPVSAKPVGARMGKGKGKLVNFAAPIKAGSLIFEICGLNNKLLIKSLLSCKVKFPIRTAICYK